MPQTFLAKKYITMGIVLIGLFFLMGFFLYSFFVTAILAALLFIFRKSRTLFRENSPTLSEGVLYSPVNGMIKKITPNCRHQTFGDHLTRVQIIIPPWKEMGVYLPFSSEVRELVATAGKPTFRWTQKEIPDQGDQLLPGLAFSLTPPSGDTVGMHLLQCVIGGWPEIAVVPGDRGKRQVNIGHLPWGGTLLLFLPQNYEILVNEGDFVSAGETLVAGRLKESRASSP